MAYLLILWSFFGFGHPPARPASAHKVVALDDDGVFKPPCPKCTKW
jgi:hypothetical protein